MKSKILRRNVSNTIKIQKFKKYALDYIKDAYKSCVLFFSYFQISGKYRGKCCRIIRGSDYTAKDIYFVAGYIDYKAVESFCSGTTGKVIIIYNQSKVSGAQNAIQTTYNNMPIIYESGAFLSDGFKFVAADNRYMSVVDYAGIQLIEPPITIYMNFYHGDNGYVFAKRDGAIRQYGEASFGLENYSYWYDSTNRILARNSNPEKFMSCWQNKTANGFIQKNSGLITNITTISDTLTNVSVFTLGAGGGLYFGGNIKTLAIFNSDQYNNYTELAALI